ncbi:hypothetical protein AAHA92_15957 [Salvia divinorum]|uniref:Uncharacterized protein n=1 Tax=Salvia divinorum TaxID=28513 RepID=A0ABD1GU02_SALDI
MAKCRYSESSIVNSLVLPLRPSTHTQNLHSQSMYPHDETPECDCGAGKMEMRCAGNEGVARAGASNYVKGNRVSTAHESVAKDGRCAQCYATQARLDLKVNEVPFNGKISKMATRSSQVKAYLW